MIAHVMTWIVSLLKDWDLVIDCYLSFGFLHFYLVAGGRWQ